MQMGELAVVGSGGVTTFKGERGAPGCELRGVAGANRYVLCRSQWSLQGWLRFDGTTAVRSTRGWSDT